MVKKLAIALTLLLLPLAAARAYDFAATVPSGQTLYFSRVAGGVEVVYPVANATPSQGWGSSPRPVGALSIPATVAQGDSLYNVVSIGHHAFYGCSGLTSVSLAEGVAAVGSSAFRLCSGLATLTLPSTLQSLDGMAFAGCTSLTDVWMAAANPPQTGSNIFFESPLGDAVLHVPCSSLEAYNEQVPWSDFGTVTDAGCTVTIVAEANYPQRGTVLGGGSYGVAATVTLVAQPADGFFFACWHDGDTLNPRTLQVMENSRFTAMFFPQQYITLAPDSCTLRVLSAQTGLGVGVGSAVLPVGAVVEVCGLPIEGARFTGWSDGHTENPRRVVLTGDLTLTALFEPASPATIDAPEPWSATVDGRRLTVSGRVGEALRLFDLQGRCLFSTTTTAATTTLMLPQAGVWLLQLGDGPAYRIVIDN